MFSEGRLRRRLGLLLSISTVLPDGAGSVKTVDSGNHSWGVTLSQEDMSHSAFWDQDEIICITFLPRSPFPSVPPICWLFLPTCCVLGSSPARSPLTARAKLFHEKESAPTKSQLDFAEPFEVYLIDVCIVHVYKHLYEYMCIMYAYMCVCVCILLYCSTPTLWGSYACFHHQETRGQTKENPGLGSKGSSGLHIQICLVSKVFFFWGMCAIIPTCSWTHCM